MRHSVEVGAGFVYIPHMLEYRSLSAGQISEGVRAGEMSAVEVVREAIRLAQEEGEEINAFVTICKEKALDQAREVDRRVREQTEDGGDVSSLAASLPLAGVPIAIKDNISYTDYPTTCGSRMLENYVPPFDATVVERLIEAGAVIVGKTNMDEFAMGSSTENSYFGPVLNPVDHALTPGGSSGGSAAAVAQGIVPVALGSETGGSVRQPASFCGLYGLKPTYGAVSRYGLVAFASSTDQIAPFARNVRDLALVYDVIAGHDPMDATSIQAKRPAYAGALGSDRKFVFGVPKEYFAEGLEPEVEKAVRKAFEVLAKAGHTVEEVSLPLTEMAIPTYYVIAPAEASSNLARFDGVRYGMRESGDKTLGEMYGDTRSAGFGAEVKRRIMLGTYVLSAGYREQYYNKATEVRGMIRREFQEVFAKVDMLITPTSPTPAFRLGEKVDNPLAMYLSDVYTVPASLAGIPAMNVPFGEASDGRPVGVQLMAGESGELALFRAAAILERLR